MGGSLIDRILKTFARMASGTETINPAPIIYKKVDIPYGTEEICKRAFDGDKGLQSLTVPSSVKKIGVRAFADCKNLTSVELAEGIEEIEDNVFTHCEKLERLVIPDSVKKLYSNAFCGATGLKEPVYSKSGDILYAYPCRATEKTFTVPATVKRINSGAFSDNNFLEEIILPDGLEIIKNRTFVEGAVRRITVPASVKKIERWTFFGCKSLERVTILGSNTKIESSAFIYGETKTEIIMPTEPRFDERIRWFGIPFLCRVKVNLPDIRYCSDPVFQGLAAACADGDAGAMWDLGNYLDALGSSEFYSYSANYWHYRAAQRGHKAAQDWIDDWIRKNPNKRMPSVFEEEIIICSNCSGLVMRRLGFMLFDEDRHYTINQPDENGVVVIQSWCDEDGPDDDGFGREDYYDWWFADENLKQIAGTKMVAKHSYRDTKNSLSYDEEYKKAVEGLRR